MKAFLQVASKAVLLQHHFSFAPSPANTILIAPQLLMSLQVFLPPPNQTFLSSHWDPFPGSTSPHQLAPALLVLQPQTPALLQNQLSGRKSRLRLALKQVLTALQPSICSSQHPGSESASFSPCVCSANRTLTGVHCLCVCFCSTTAWKLLFSGLRLVGGWELLNQVDPAVYFFLVGEKNMSS